MEKAQIVSNTFNLWTRSSTVNVPFLLLK